VAHSTAGKEASALYNLWHFTSQLLVIEWCD